MTLFGDADEAGPPEPLEPFAEERAFWYELRTGLRNDPDLAGEVSAALAEANRRYDTVIFENRFIVGGITEQIIGSAARALGIEIRNAAKALAGVDLRLPAGGGLSVKAVFSSTWSSVRLINTLGAGGSERRWEEATIFVIRDVGIGYADPEYLKEATSFTGDAVELKSAVLRELWLERPHLLCDTVTVERKPKHPNNPRAASDLVSHDLLASYSRLGRHWSPELG